MFRSTYSLTRYLWLSLVAYGVAKVFEEFDRSVYAFTGHIISGYTIKHLLAALSCYFIYLYLTRRRIKATL